MDNHNVSTSRVALRYGFMAGIAGIIYYLIMQFAGLSNSGAFQWIGLIIIILAIIFGINNYKRQNKGYISYSQGLGLGVLLSAIYGVISGLFNFIYLKFIDNSSIKKGMDLARENMENKGMSEEQIEQAMQYSEKFASPGFIFLVGILASLLIGLVLSLIIAAFMKKNNPELMD